jgi:hypothetical protein
MEVARQMVVCRHGKERAPRLSCKPRTYNLVVHRLREGARVNQNECSATTPGVKSKIALVKSSLRSGLYPSREIADIQKVMPLSTKLSVLSSIEKTRNPHRRKREVCAAGHMPD